MFMGDIVRMHGRRFANKTALVDEEGEATFGEVNQRVNQLVNLFHAKGLQKGDRIALLSYNSNTYAEILLAILKAGFVLVPINYRLLAKEFTYILKDAEPKVFLFSDDFL